MDITKILDIVVGKVDVAVKFWFELLYQFFGNLWNAFLGMITGLFGMVNLFDYFGLFFEYGKDIGVLGWLVGIITLVLFAALIAALIFLIVLLVKRYINLRVKKINQEALIDEVGRLNREVRNLTKDKNRLLAKGLGEGMTFDHDDEEYTKKKETMLGTGESRFYKLTKVDEKYVGYDPECENFDNSITLEELCERFRNFACSQLNLYYDIRIIRLFVAAFSSTRLIILQGISGTGKTSLPYAWGKFLENDTQIASVQPSWRDRTSLYGFFNEFTKRFNETEVLRTMYEATYTDKVYLTILDEMNIAKVEYYFAEMLSILEMPSKDEWVIDLVPSGWENDPKHIVEGRFQLPTNLWYVGTANNDDSTFAISDKVYDRAIPININSKGVAFDAPETEPLSLSAKHLDSLFLKAQEENVVSEETIQKLDLLDDYVILHFRLAFGNRIVKQLKEFIPAYVACGGTEIDGLDYVLANKIFRKFDQMNLTFIRDEIDGLIDKLHELFGDDAMGESVEYLKRLQKL